MTVIPVADPRVRALEAAVRAGDLPALRALITEHPELATGRFGDADMSRTALHVATDWPGHPLRVAATIALLVEAGAEVDARFVGQHAETPLHWAASSDDVEAVDALLDAGADIEATGAVLTGGTPMSDAVVFKQWNAARRLLERGASTTIWQAAALGAIDRVSAYLDGSPAPAGQDVTNALWHACSGGQRETALLLAGRGGDAHWLGWNDLTPIGAAVAAGAHELAAALRSTVPADGRRA